MKNKPVQAWIRKILFGDENITPKEMQKAENVIRAATNMLIGFFIIFFAVFVVNALQRYDQLQEKTKKLESEVVRLEENNKKLREQKKSLETAEEIEKVARKELGLVKPGEIPYVK